MNETSKEAEINLYDDYSKMMAKNIANSAVNIALYRISQDRDWRYGVNNLSLEGGTVNVSVTARPDIDTDALEINSYSAFNGFADTINVILSARPINNTFSRYSYFSDFEPVIWFYSADTLLGPVHTNGTFNMNGTPTFFGEVTSPNSPNLAGGANPQYLGGTNFSASPVTLPTDINQLRDAAVAGGHMETSGVLRINFLADGTYDYKVGTGSWQNKAISSTNGVIGCTKNINVTGVINGQVTVFSSKNIRINGDLIYNDDPKLNPDSDDICGLVALKNVIVNTTSDTRIHATILALSTSFKANDIYFTPTARLELLGGIVQDQRGAVGTLAPSGFEKFYEYDDRLEYMSPPYYPIAGGSSGGQFVNSLITFISWMEY
ncbi:MAG: hypothetical protein GY863_14610 [bacterium]|nr:hypothetical protein [bacterium]